jgi:hypothetical protein
MPFTTSIEPVQKLVLEYDMGRGGFMLLFGPCSRERQRPVLNGLASIFFDEQNRTTGIESAWGRGGIALEEFHFKFDSPHGTFPVEAAESQFGRLILNQNPRKVLLWCASRVIVPRSEQPRVREAEAGVTFFFSRLEIENGKYVARWGQHNHTPVLAGLVIEIQRTVISGPITSLELIRSDFK